MAPMKTGDPAVAWELSCDDPWGARPLTTSARDLARRVRRWAGVSGGERCEPAALLARRGWSLRFATLRADNDGNDALLIPRARGGFEVVVDPRLARREVAALRSEIDRVAATADVVALRIGHEIGHTFFFSEGAPPRRRIAYSQAEEIYCDQFARALVGRTSAAARLFSPTRAA